MRAQPRERERPRNTRSAESRPPRQGYFCSAQNARMPTTSPHGSTSGTFFLCREPLAHPRHTHTRKHTPFISETLPCRRGTPFPAPRLAPAQCAFLDASRRLQLLRRHPPSGHRDHRTPTFTLNHLFAFDHWKQRDLGLPSIPCSAPPAALGLCALFLAHWGSGTVAGAVGPLGGPCPSHPAPAQPLSCRAGVGCDAMPGSVGSLYHLFLLGWTAPIGIARRGLPRNSLVPGDGV